MARPRPSPFLLALLSVVALLAAVSVAANGEGCASLGLKIQTGACSSAPSGLLHAFDSPDKASRGLASSCGELANLASPPPTAECCLDLAAFGGAGCACDPVTLTLAQMALNLNGDGMKSLIRAATAACSAVGVKVSDSCGGETC